MSRHVPGRTPAGRGAWSFAAVAGLACGTTLGLGVLGPWAATETRDPPEDRPEYAIDKATLRALIDRAGSPVEEHRALSPLVGAFDCLTTLRSGPGAAPIVTRSVASSGWMMDGRFVRLIGTPVAGEELPIESMHVLGFDRRAGVYFCWSIDSTDTYGLIARGTVDETDGAIVLHGTSESTGGAAEPFRQTIVMESPDRFTVRVWLRNAEATLLNRSSAEHGWYMAVESVYTRQ